MISLSTHHNPLGKTAQKLSGVLGNDISANMPSRLANWRSGTHGDWMGSTPGMCTESRKEAKRGVRVGMTARGSSRGGIGRRREPGFKEDWTAGDFMARNEGDMGEPTRPSANRPYIKL